MSVHNFFQIGYGCNGSTFSKKALDNKRGFFSLSICCLQYQKCVGAMNFNHFIALHQPQISLISSSFDKEHIWKYYVEGGLPVIPHIHDKNAPDAQSFSASDLMVIIPYTNKPDQAAILVYSMCSISLVVYEVAIQIPQV